MFAIVPQDGAQVASARLANMQQAKVVDFTHMNPSASFGAGGVDEVVRCGV
jgi:hypothetical protein